MLGNIEERILAISREHPDYGARRIVPLLKQEDIFISASTIYNILKRNGLETRTKRLSKLGKAYSQDRIITARKTPTKITPELEKQIVAVSLQHTDFGTRRLVPLLKEKDISVSESTVYMILKRRGIQTRALRLSKLEAQEPAEIPTQMEPKVQVRKDAVEINVLPQRPPIPKAPPAPPKRGYWLFHVLNLLLFVLGGYLGYHAVQNFQKADEQPEAFSPIDPTPVHHVPVADTAIRPLQDYRAIWQRDLFHTNKENLPAPEEKISLENLAVAEEDIGLRLVGTIVADDAALSRAVIDIEETDEQKMYFEGDQAGKFKIKKILRNNVIISTENGDELLTIYPENSGKIQKASGSEQYTPLSLSSTDEVFEGGPAAGQSREKRLSIEDITSSLDNFGELMHNMQITPYTKDDQPLGLKITGLTSKNILRNMGLRNGDVIMGVNDEPVTDPDHIGRLFAELTEGGEFTIKIKRRRRNRTLRLNIE